MQRHEVTENKVELFLKDSAQYQELKKVTADFNSKMDVNTNAMCDTFEQCRSFKALYLILGKVNSGVLETCAKENGKTKEEFEQELKGYTETMEYKPIATFIFSLIQFGDAVKPHFDAEIAKEKEAVHDFIKKDTALTSLDQLVNQCKNPSQASTANMIKNIKEADTFDELLKLTSSIQNNSYSQRTYAWMNAGIFGGASAINYQLMLLKNAVGAAHDQFKQVANASEVAPSASLSLRQ